MTTLLLEGGFHPGPLFTVNKRRMPKRYGTVMQGRLRRESERRATPTWVDKVAVNRLYHAVRHMNKTAGGQAFNVGHIVPLLSPYVCGLHVETNMCIQTREENARLSNLTWPDMPEIQLELPLWDSPTAATSAKPDTTWLDEWKTIFDRLSAGPVVTPRSTLTAPAGTDPTIACVKDCITNTA